jgi:hypothetical protein
MADTGLFTRLKKLFATGVIVRRMDDNKLKVVDTSKLQSDGNLASNRSIDRFSRLHGTPNNHGYNYSAANYDTQRLNLFSDYETMDEDSIISSALDIYADECTTKNEFGDILTITSGTEEVQKILRNLFYDVLNVEFNLWPWIRNMCKYGDSYLKMDITEKYGVTNVTPVSAYEMFREEGTKPDKPEYTVFYHDESIGSQPGGYSGSGKKKKLESYEVAHFRLISDTNFLPYGRSIVEPARKTWKQLVLMEDAMMLHRIMRAPSKRIFRIDIGNIPPSEVDSYMNTVINKMKKVPYVNESDGTYNLKFNLQNMMEDFYLPVRGGQSGTEVSELPGLDGPAIDDVEYLKSRMMAALRVPRAFLGYDENIDGKATLAALDVRFSRTIERLQRIFISELTKIAIVHLYSQGFKDEALVDFSLELNMASTIAEQEKLAIWEQKIGLAEGFKANRMVSQEWIYENIFKMTPEEWREEKDKVIEDIKRNFRYSQIEMEGNDPAVTQQSFGTMHDLTALQMAAGGAPAGDPKFLDIDPSATDGDDYTIAGSDQGGRPSELGKGEGSYGTDDHVRGRDPLGFGTLKKDYKNPDRSIRAGYKSNIANKIISEMSKKKQVINETFNTKEKIYDDTGGLLDENNLLSEDSNGN